MKPENKRPVTVEDLLRLKRAERPVADFWTTFDRQLRAKQLSALVGKRPWWQDLSLGHLFSGLRRYHLPLGAAAAVAVTFVSFRVSQPVAPVAAQPLVGAPSVAAKPSVAAPAARQPEMTAVVTKPDSFGSERMASTVSQTAAVAEAAVEDAAAVAQSGSFPWLGVSTESLTSGAATPASRYVSSSLVSTPVADSLASTPLLHATSRFEARSIAARATVEPLHQITPPSERRGTRILTAMVSMASVESAMRTTERAASRLSEEQLYDQIHRFGARGAGVNLKF